MKNNIIKFAALIGGYLLGSVLFSSCTDNQRAKYFGGTKTIELPKNHILMNVTWKGDQVWVLSKDTTTNKSYFHEDSKWGIIEGTILIKESK